VRHLRNDKELSSEEEGVKTQDWARVNERPDGSHKALHTAAFKAINPL